jgi:oxygen-independent coproporphyrinogen-3 oxidase
MKTRTSDVGRLTSDVQGPGLYVHVPFCKSKCPYCAFDSITSPFLIPAYLDGIEREAALRAGLFPGPFDTVYLGGGTPTVLSAGQTVRLLAGLRRSLRIAEGAEVTVEANPGDASFERLKLLRGLGVNRLSLGVQSLRDRELRFLGRRHTADQALAAYAEARRAGFSNVSIDLIYALPRQDWPRWRETLEAAVALRPEHLSCYQLTIDERSPFGWMAADGKLVAAGEDAQADLFLATSAFLEDAGYVHYEVSSFALNDARRSRHNAKYWVRAPCLGLGPSAHSFAGTRRWWNPRGVDAWRRALSEGRDPSDGSEDLTPEQARLEAVSLGMRTRDGIALDVLDGVPGLDARVERLASAGLVGVEGGRVRPTRQGMLVADRLPLDLLG